jgi:hypothetical protein
MLHTDEIRIWAADEARIDFGRGRRPFWVTEPLAWEEEGSQFQQAYKVEWFRQIGLACQRAASPVPEPVGAPTDPVF